MKQLIKRCKCNQCLYQKRWKSYRLKQAKRQFRQLSKDLIRRGSDLIPIIGSITTD